MELPVNAIVIVAIAVLVLVVLAAFFTGFIGRSFGTINHNDAWTRGCSTAKAQGCLVSAFTGTTTSESALCTDSATPCLTITDYDPDGDGRFDSLLTACSHVFGISVTDATAPEQCRTKCCGY